MLAKLETWLNLNGVTECRIGRVFPGEWKVWLENFQLQSGHAIDGSLPQALRQAMENLQKAGGETP